MNSPEGRFRAHASLFGELGTAAHETVIKTHLLEDWRRASPLELRLVLCSVFLCKGVCMCVWVHIHAHLRIWPTISKHPLLFLRLWLGFFNVVFYNQKYTVLVHTQIRLRITPTLLPKTQENVFMKISCKTENTSYWTHWHDPQCPHTLSIYPMHFNCECSVEPLFSFWRQLQCIIVLSWQQGIVMELSSCTHMQMKKWLTLHNTPWMVRSLFGNADEHGPSLIREQTYRRILHTLEIPSNQVMNFLR